MSRIRHRARKHVRTQASCSSGTCSAALKIFVTCCHSKMLRILWIWCPKTCKDADVFETQKSLQEPCSRRVLALSVFPWRQPCSLG
eukprot:s2689_g14.t1